jgi:hypothetical protein
MKRDKDEMDKQILVTCAGQPGSIVPTVKIETVI